MTSLRVRTLDLSSLASICRLETVGSHLPDCALLRPWERRVRGGGGDARHMPLYC